jgi:hypothetical protein
MNKKRFWIVTLFLLVAGTFAEAQQAAKVWRIGVLVSSSALLAQSRILARSATLTPTRA